MLMPRRDESLRRRWGALWSVFLLGAPLYIAGPAAADTGRLIPAGKLLDSFHSGSRRLQDVSIPQTRQPNDDLPETMQAHSEPAAWSKHFQHRQLQQSGLAVAPEAGFGFDLLQATPPAASPPTGSTDQLFTKTSNNSDTQRLTALDTGALSDISQMGAVPLAPGPGTAELSSCNTLAYGGGYANIMISVQPYQMVRFTANKGQCCDLCDADSNCSAWMRVAGGQASTRACYLMNFESVNTTAAAAAIAAPASAPEAEVQIQSLDGSSAPGPTAIASALSAAAPSPAATTNASVQTLAPEAATAAYDSWPLVQYMNSSQPVILESGTKTSGVFPAAMYGCPYPPSASDTCEPPPFCNCFDDICYGSCQDNGGNGL